MSGNGHYGDPRYEQPTWGPKAPREMDISLERALVEQAERFDCQAEKYRSMANGAFCNERAQYYNSIASTMNEAARLIRTLIPERKDKTR